MPRIGSHSTTTTPSTSTALLKQGSTGPAVERARQQLIAAGFDPGSTSGTFTAQMKAAVVAFQTSHGLTADGVLGPKSQAELARAAAPTPPAPPTRPTAVPIALAPAGASEAQKFDHYAAIIRAAGGQVNPNGQPTILGLRGVPMGGGDVHATATTMTYDDSFVLLTADKHVYELKGATHPSLKDCSDAPDVTGDGKSDVGMIAPGNYKVVPHGDYMGNKSFQIVTAQGAGGLPGWRDTNQDGFYSDAEKAGSRARGDKVAAVLFHQGSSNAPISIGCQTLPPSEFQRLLNALGGINRLSYTLVDAHAP